MKAKNRLGRVAGLHERAAGLKQGTRKKLALWIGGHAVQMLRGLHELAFLEGDEAKSKQAPLEDIALAPYRIG